MPGSLLDVFLFLRSALHHIIESWPGTHRVGLGFYHISLEVELPRTPDYPEGRHRVKPISRGNYDFVRVCTQHECIMLSSLSFSVVWYVHPRRSATKEEDNVTATSDCGRVMVILDTPLATRIRSLVIILPIHLITITGVHVCNHLPIIPICMPTRPNAGVRALPWGLVDRYCHNTVVTVSVSPLRRLGGN